MIKIIESKKGMYFTIMAVFMIMLFTFLFFIPDYKREQEKMFVTEMRVNSMNDLLKGMQRDAERGLYISSYRALLALEDQIIKDRSFLDNSKARFEEAVLYGTIYGEPSTLMTDSTFPEWITKIENDFSEFNVDVNITMLGFAVYHGDPWHVTANANLSISMKDATNIASWERTEVIKSRVTIIDFEDPLYIINSYGRASNPIIKTPYEGNYTYDDGGINIDNLLDHLENSYYSAHNDAPSFLMRLENNIDSSPYGIESLVNLRDLDALGLNISYESSAVDYYYWYSENNGNYRINGTPSWFRLDAGHLEKYNVTDLSYIE